MYLQDHRGWAFSLGLLALVVLLIGSAQGAGAIVQAEEAGITVSKTADPTFGSPSTNVTFNLTVTNNGNATLPHVFVSDLLPEGMSYVSSKDGGVNNGRYINWSDVGPLSGGAKKSLELVAHIDDPVSGIKTLTNRVDVEAKPEHGNNVNANASAIVQAEEAGITVSKTADPTFGSPSTNVTFNLTVTNNGNATLPHIFVSDLLPEGMSYVSSKGGGVNNGRYINWSDAGPLNGGAKKSLELVAHINGPVSGIKTLTNRVDVEAKPEHGNNVTANASAIVQARNVTCISGYKNDTFGNRLAGWTIFVDNDGDGEFDSGEPNGTTNSTGRWQICSLSFGEYTVCEVQQKGWTPIDPPDGCHHNVILVPGQNVTLDFTNDRRNLTITKVADKYEVKSGEEVTYTITVCNNGGTDVGNVTVWDVFNRYVELLWSSPAPGPDGKWHFGTLQPGECSRTITIKIRVPERQDFEFGMEQGVSGEGFVNVANDYSTTFEAYLIKNCAYATSDWNPKDPISDCVTVTVGEELGTELETREYGSGLFDVEERVAIFTENKSISMEKDVSATYAPTTLGLYNNRTAVYSSRWTEEARAKNRITGASMSESYRYATSIDRRSRMFLDENESVMEVESEFDGRGHVGFLKMPSNTSTPQTTPLFEAREDYVGSFKILERVDEYGSAVSSEKAASGEGLVVVDKRVGDVQRSYESGSGSYDSEEIVETSTNYIAKDISLVYAPPSQTLTDDVAINSSMKWKEGMYSKNLRVSYIGEEYTSITELDKETVARGLNDMATDADFSGRARFRAVLERNVGDPEVNFDEEYDGDYSVERRVIFTGVAKYSTPHLNVTKTMVGNVTEETLPWDRDEVHLAGEVKTRKVATYTIRIENDGNKALGPVYVQDLFPPGSAFIEASLRPSELTDSYANWTLLNLGIGDVVNINLKLDVTGYHPSELVNRVEVCAGINNGDEWICVSNFSALEVDWLTCCPNETVSVTKTAKLDPVNDSVVRYRVEIRNVEDATRVATVTDRLPAGMDLIDSSTPVASYEDGVVVWNLIEIKPFETVTIEFSALAPGNGRFTNSVEVDPRSVDGSVVQPVRATCVIDVGTVEDECGPVSCDVWQPPNWELDHVGYPTEMTCEENCGLAP